MPLQKGMSSIKCLQFYVMLCLYRFIYTLVSLSLLATIYMVNSKTTIKIWESYDFPTWASQVCSYLLYLGICLLATWAMTLGYKYLGKIEMHFDTVTNIEAADMTFIPVYFAYVFVGVSIQSWASLLFCYALLAIICFFTQTYLFNPLSYLLGYRYYFVTNTLGKKLLVMSRKNITLDKRVDFNDLRRLNSFTYIDMEK